MTLFALVADTQYHEWYGNDDFTEGRYKPKFTGNDLIAQLTLTDVQTLGTDNLERLVTEFMPESNDYAKYTLLDWELVELNEQLVREVKDLLDDRGDESPSYIKFCFENDVAFDWAVKQLPPAYEKLNWY